MAPITQSGLRLRVRLRGAMAANMTKADDVAQQDVEHRVDAPDGVLDDDEVEAPDDGDREERQVGDELLAASCASGACVAARRVGHRASLPGDVRP